MEYLSKVLKLKTQFKSKEKIFPNVHCKGVDDYFELPKSKREKFGIYLTPYALPSEILDKEKKGWSSWSKIIRKKYPVQGWIREWFFSYDNPLYRFIRITSMKFNSFYYNIKRFFKPCSPRFFKSWRRWEYMDKVEAIQIVNFAMIQDFWHDEINRDYVDWESDTAHKIFYEWIKSAISWIEVERQICENRLSEAYNIAHKKNTKNYYEKYSEVHEIEKLIDEKDEQILIDMIKYRKFFWT